MIQLLMAAMTAGVLTLVGTPFFIRFLRSRGVGQEIREDGPDTHHVKRGTPTMGGVVILAAVVVAYVVAHAPVWSTPRPISYRALLVLFGGCAMGLLGFLDDFLKYRNQRSLGLNKTAKILGQVAIAIVFAVLALRYTGVSTSVSFVRPTTLVLPIGLFVLLVLLLFAGAANGVNLTDGLDGLAAGSANFVFAAFVLIAFWQFRHPAFYFPDLVAQGLEPQILDLAVVAAAFMGACVGFLWWNTNPARIFMGDTGSLGLGGALAALALLTNTELLLLVLGGLFVLETVSVIIQVFSFRVFGRRVFKMAPIHHHFELMGWPEITVIVRFWIISAIFVTLGMGVFYSDWLRFGAAA